MANSMSVNIPKRIFWKTDSNDKLLEKEWEDEGMVPPYMIPFLEAYTFWEVHGEQHGMGYGLHLPRTSEVGNQVHQDDPVNEAVRDVFGVQDDNFTVEYTLFTKQSLLAQFSTDGCIPLRGFLGNLNLT
ncbi:hypothetical protein K1719_004183 [Acacia pycnantha]|nr:hypothetical protein K1719_004183 [Acacia pycnantha]